MKTISIERALTWAYAEELPKAAAARGGMGGVAPRGVGGEFGRAMGRFRDLLAVVDVNDYGVVVDTTAVDEPHSDAVRIAEAVDGLGGLAIVVVDVVDLVCDLSHLGADILAAGRAAIDEVSAVDADGDRVLRFDLGALVRRHAMLGRGPALSFEVPKRVPLVGANGRPVWRRRVRRAIGWDAAGVAVRWEECEVDVSNAHGRLADGAYLVSVWRPDPVPMLVARLTWAAWVAALDHLVGVLDGVLDEVAVTASGRAWRPWAGEVDAAGRRVLPVVARGAGRGRRAET